MKPVCLPLHNLPLRLRAWLTGSQELVLLHLIDLSPCMLQRCCVCCSNLYVWNLVNDTVWELPHNQPVDFSDREVTVSTALALIESYYHLVAADDVNQSSTSSSAVSLSQRLRARVWETLHAQALVGVCSHRPCTRTSCVAGASSNELACVVLLNIHVWWRRWLSVCLQASKSKFPGVQEATVRACVRCCAASC